MSVLGPHAAYVAAAYAATLATLAGLLAWAGLSERAARRRLAALEAELARGGPER
jgi:heme exporter protein CcmD